MPTGERLEAFARGTANYLIHREWVEAGGAGWGPWQYDLDGEVLSSPAAIYSADGSRIDLFALRPRNTHEQRTRNGRTWGVWLFVQDSP